MAEKLKITYATLSDSNEGIHTGYEAGLAEARTLLGASYGNFVNGAWLTDGPTFEKRSPDRKSTRLNSSHIPLSRMPSSA